MYNNLVCGFRKGLVGLLGSVCLTISAQFNVRKEVKIPDIPGYLTLKCDLHMHSVFSDGLVWPTVRADEAWREGLDAIAISEHVEYHPYQEDLPVQFGRSHEIIKPRAEMYDLILIRGAEITRDMPPGHFNCLFLDDVSALDKEDFWEAMQAAAEQGAFIFWNHPGWRQPGEIPVWYDDHTRLYENRLMHGMEIVNASTYYPLAYQWCIEKEITIIGNSDIHNPIHMDYSFRKGSHRPMTLVFATERSPDAIKEALFVGRTVVYFEDMLMGQARYLLPIFERSVQARVSKAGSEGGKINYVLVANTSGIPFKLRAGGTLEDYSFPGTLILYPESTVVMRITSSRGKGLQSLRIPYIVENLLVGPEKGLPVELQVEP